MQLLGKNPLSDQIENSFEKLAFVKDSAEYTSIETALQVS